MKIIKSTLAAILVTSVGILSLVTPVIAAPVASPAVVSVKAPLESNVQDVRGFLLDTTGFSPRFADLSFSLGSKFFGERLSWGRGLLGQYRSIELPVEVSEDEADLMARELSLKFGSRVIPQVTFRKSVETDPGTTLNASAVQASPTWGLDRIDQRELPLDSRYEYGSDGTGVTVYVVDTGILATHNEFAGRIGEGYSSISDGLGTTDCDGHGTHVAGTVGGTAYGVAKDVTLVPVRVLDCEGSGSDSTVISGIEWVIDNHAGGPAVMNLSLGGGYSAPLNQAVRRVHEAGIVVVVASGNDGSDACSDSPGSEPTAITVNASTSSDDDASFSNYGSCTDIYAPGQGIRSAFIGGNSQTASLSGTSMAAPHVAGAASLILEQNPNLTPSQVWSQMAEAATDIDWYYTEADAKILLFTGSELSSFANPPTPSISGTAATGETLSADPGDWSVTCDCTPTFEYAWLRNGNPISGATELTYDLRGSDNGTRISFGVTASADGFVDAVVTSSQTDRVSAGFTTASTPTITGTATSGQTLRVSTGSWSPRPRFSYQWNCDGEPISRATRSSLRLSSSHNDCMITVSVRATARNVATTTRVSESVGPVGTQFASAPAPTINGNAGYGNLLTAMVSSWAPTPTSLSYQWYYGDGSEITGATSSSYLVSEDDYGNSIYLCITGRASGYVDTVRCSSETGVVLGFALSHAPTPEISGQVAIGNTVTAIPGTWDSGVALSYQWFRGASPISGAISPTYTITNADSGAMLSVMVTGSKSGYVSVVKSSIQHGPVAQGFTSYSPPTITGTPTSGQTLRVSTGTWSPRPRFSYQWNCDGEPINRATRSSLRLAASQNGCEITVTVTATARDVTTTVLTSEPVGPVGTQFSSAPAPTISGSAGYENVLTAIVGSWSPTPTTLNYQWHYGNGSAINGAIDASYLVSDADYGNSIYVCVTGQRSGYVETVRCSSETDDVLGYALSLTPTPEIIGVVGIGNTVSVDLGTWDDGVTHAIQWLRNGSPIPGATEPEYLVTNSDSGASLSVSVTGELDGYSAVTRVSVQHGPVAMAFTRAPDPTISGTFRERSTLRVRTGSWSPRPRFSYQWYRDGEPISRATRTSYRLTSSDVGSRITVAVTATARGYTTVTKFSSESGLVASRR